jgi:hypothetical protein
MHFFYLLKYKIKRILLANRFFKKGIIANAIFCLIHLYRKLSNFAFLKGFIFTALSNIELKVESF